MRQATIDKVDKQLRLVIAEAFKEGRMSRKTGKNVIGVIAEMYFEHLTPILNIVKEVEKKKLAPPSHINKSNMKNIKCSKCGGLRVERFSKEPPVENPPVSMEDFAKNDTPYMITTLAHIMHTYVLLCKDCGHRIEYTR